MFAKVIEVFSVAELRKKILTTLGLLLAYRIGFHIPLPGVNIDVLEKTADTLGGSLGILNALSGGAIGSSMLFSLGVMPYISASIIFSLLTKMVPSLEALSKEGQAGQRKINQYTRFATVPICLLQAFFIVRGLMASDVKTNTDPLIDPVLFSSFFYQLGLILMMTTGTLLIMWIGEKITENGIGNGISLIIMAGILATVPSLVRTTLSTNQENQTQALALIVCMFVCVVAVIVYFTKAHRRIPIQQAKLTRGRRQLGGARHYIPLKILSANVMPIIFASALFIIPNLLSNVPGLGWMDQYFGYTSFFYIVAYTALIIFFAFFWTALMFQPTEMANNLKEYGSFIPGIRPGKKTADHLEQVMVRVTLVGAAFLAGIALFPQIAANLFTDVQVGLVYVIGGTSILIVVGVCLDLVDKINAHLTMRNYEGFSSGAGNRSTSWARGRK
jgi:preprotein translocase subunit SecY